jgi:hypothetical protein
MRLLESTMEHLETFNMVVGDHKGSEVSTAYGIADVLTYLVRAGEESLSLEGWKAAGSL